MAQYLLDTDVCIELIKHNERVLDKVEKWQKGQVTATSEAS